MTDQEIREIVVSTLARVAPEIDPAAIRPDAPLRDQVDVDSMDFLNFVIALHERFSVEIPEADYGRLSTVADIAAYLRVKAPAERRGG
jgi:acyl carrier protein